jgi:Raf kinase inhibitor-like YbhB/YbcL family protein
MGHSTTGLRAALLYCGVLAACSGSSSGSGVDTATDGGGGGADAAGQGQGNDAGGAGDDGGGVTTDAGTADTAPPPGSDAAAAFALTSTALAEGATFGAANTCDGANTSPPFHWVGAPAGAQSFALVLTDKTNGLVHWAIYDIPPSIVDVAAAIPSAYQPAFPAGAKQARSISGSPVYAGPCPPKGGGAHTYDFALYAVDVAALPGTTANTTKDAIVALLATHGKGTAHLTGTYAR